MITGMITLLLCFCLFFCQFQPGEAYKSIKKACLPLPLECKSSSLENQHCWKLLRDFTLWHISPKQIPKTTILGKCCCWNDLQLSFFNKNNVGSLSLSLSLYIYIYIYFFFFFGGRGGRENEERERGHKASSFCDTPAKQLQNLRPAASKDRVGFD